MNPCTPEALKLCTREDAVAGAPAVRPYVDGEDLTGRLMCYRCHHSFPAPKDARCSTPVKCPNCKRFDGYNQHKCADTDPLRHSAGWPYDDPTVACDC